MDARLTRPLGARACHVARAIVLVDGSAPRVGARVGRRLAAPLGLARRILGHAALSCSGGQFATTAQRPVTSGGAVELGVVNELPVRGGSSINGSPVAANVLPVTCHRSVDPTHKAPCPESA
jgi:hypothetical protein